MSIKRSQLAIHSSQYEHIGCWKIMIFRNPEQVKRNIRDLSPRSALTTPIDKHNFHNYG